MPRRPRRGKLLIGWRWRACPDGISNREEEGIVPTSVANQSGSVLVIGGGVGGMRAAIDLAEAGIHTYVVEALPSLGGRVAQLGFMFPTHDCVLCRGTSDHGFGCTRPAISPALLDQNRHPNITLISSAELLRLDGQAGNFEALLRQHPQYVNPSMCINCGKCAEICPEVRPSGFQMDLSVRKAIDKSAPRSVPNAYYLLEKTPLCDACHKCVEVCPTHAINLDAQPRDITVQVGAVILAMGFEPFNAHLMPELGYGRIPDVITSLQYERLASRSGPTEGTVRRISDGKLPRRIAWLQCVGSRDQRNPYCSSICCMYATKQAVLAKQRIPGVECYIFTMDERAFNKEYNHYYRESEREFGIHYNRCRISAVAEDPQTGDVILRYPSGRGHFEADARQGTMIEEHFDLVVLAVGIRPPRQAVEMARSMGIDLNEYGFCETDKFNPLSTSRPGVFVCGAFASPKEIAETIIDASGAAAQVMRLLRDRPKHPDFTRAQPFIAQEPLAPELSVEGEEPAIAVALCRCLGENDGVIDFDALADYVSNLPHVVSLQDLPAACLPEGMVRLREMLDSAVVNRLVIGACSHRTHEPLFQRIAAEAGINPYLMEMVNLREHCAWVHADDPVGATHKACEQMRMSVERVCRARPVHKEERQPKRAALIVGGGVSGMTAALAIADTGFRVHLVEKSGELGGNLHHIYYVAEPENPQHLLRDLVNRVVAHERITLYLHSEVIGHTGSTGDFRTRLRTVLADGNQRQTDIEHGVVILATGGVESEIPASMPGEDPRLIRQSELEVILAHQPQRAAKLQSVVMLQCVQSDDRPEYCSRICCTNTIKNAIRLKMINPECQVVIMYKNIITYGFREKFYIEARRRGVLFVRYTEDEPPVVRLEARGAGQALTVSVKEHVFGKTLVFEPDLVALSTMIVPSKGTAELAKMMGIPLSVEGFFQEAHLKMRPMDVTDEGIFLAGMAHYPKFLEECISNALACAGRALATLNRPEIHLGGVVAVVDPARCTGCLTCVRTCPFSIPAMRYEQAGVGNLGGAAWIDPARCQGCGTCTGECPARAIQLVHYRDEQIRIGLGSWLAPMPQLAAE
jgi:heterodisulfide reductase subunit A